jgi:hypothetical protein
LCTGYLGMLGVLCNCFHFHCNEVQFKVSV